MKNTLLFSTLIAGLALAGCNKSTRTSTASDYSGTTPATTADQVAADTRSATDRMAADTRAAADRAGQNIQSGVNSATNAIGNAASNVAHSARMTEWRLNASDIQADVDANREIVRTKTSSGTAAGAPTGSMDKSTLQAAVEGRIRADAELSTFKIDVDPGADGEINLDGEVNSAAHVGKAIALALDTDGVTKVKSKIEVDKKANADRR